jgi:hypothetical protein
VRSEAPLVIAGKAPPNREVDVLEQAAPDVGVGFVRPRLPIECRSELVDGLPVVIVPCGALPGLVARRHISGSLWLTGLFTSVDQTAAIIVRERAIAPH